MKLALFCSVVSGRAVPATLIMMTGSLGCVSGWAAAGTAPLVVTIQNHVFQPTELHFPANQRVKITVKNLDSTAEEFESPGLKVEKVIAGNGQGTFWIKPAAHGRYTFVGEYHEKTARGVAVVE